MLFVDDLIDRNLSVEHRKALQWFWSNRGQQVAWKTIQWQANQSDGFRLVTQAKGIYKPRYTDYALSVRTLWDGPYPDKEVEFRKDGSWVCDYFQENPDPALRDKEATNRGLMKCLEDRMPVGMLIKGTARPGVIYEVAGLGLVLGWTDGYFRIEGFSTDGRHPSVHT